MTWTKRARRGIATPPDPLAIIIEASDDLAGLVADVLAELGFETMVARSHVYAATLVESRCPQLLVACVPAYHQDSRGAYLRDCRRMLGLLPTVLMLSEAHPDLRGAPSAVYLMKPFTRAELLLAVDEALATEEEPSPD
ncbi:DNA-binding transcriptional response regulator [Luteibacter sahnii]|uniref:hypothetical protein n=1 Tax=Luteibacter sahnii TaxID=3021977 RepID=UPI002A6A0335|nr:hypothetical protein [Luteibacter sp. PPL193]MDY1549540.1 hypothetical protein [Luteibacter sp. PPL193]